MVSRDRGDKTEHRWRLVTHMDGCHWYASIYVCRDCGASIATHDERDPSEDPYSLIWMDPGYDEDGQPVECKRCRELQEGAEPDHHVNYEPA